MNPPYTPLDYDPFAADQFDPADKMLKDKMVKARKHTQCTHCKGPIVPTSQYRLMVGLIDGSIHQVKFCADCCAAMVQELNDLDDENLEHIVYHFEARFKRDEEVKNVNP
jgi:hypothetical protein